MAVKVTLVPLHIAPLGLATITTLAGTGALTISAILLDVAGEPVTHGSLDVMTHAITSPLAVMVSIKVEFVWPEILLPFLCHW